MDRAESKVLTGLLLDFLVVADGVLDGSVLLLDKRSIVNDQSTRKTHIIFDLFI